MPHIHDRHSTMGPDRGATPLRERLASRSRPGIGPEGVQLHARGHQEDFATIMARMKAAKPEVMKRQMDLLTARYDLSNRAQGVTMTRGKALRKACASNCRRA